jgi:DNA gyrase/topoisomerase IV subunit B
MKLSEKATVQLVLLSGMVVLASTDHDGWAIICLILTFFVEN